MKKIVLLAMLAFMVVSCSSPIVNVIPSTTPSEKGEGNEGQNGNPGKDEEVEVNKEGLKQYSMSSIPTNGFDTPTWIGIFDNSPAIGGQWMFMLVDGYSTIGFGNIEKKYERVPNGFTYTDILNKRKEDSVSFDKVYTHWCKVDSAFYNKNKSLLPSYLAFVPKTYTMAMTMEGNEECKTQQENITFLDDKRFTRENIILKPNYSTRSETAFGFYKLLNDVYYFYTDENMTTPYYFLRADGKRDLASMKYNRVGNYIKGNSSVYNLNLKYEVKNKAKPLSSSFRYYEESDNDMDVKSREAIFSFNENGSFTAKSEIVRVSGKRDCEVVNGFYRIIENSVCFYTDSTYNNKLKALGFEYLDMSDAQDYLYAKYGKLDVRLNKVTK